MKLQNQQLHMALQYEIKKKIHVHKAVLILIRPLCDWSPWKEEKSGTMKDLNHLNLLKIIIEYFENVL